MNKNYSLENLAEIAADIIASTHQKTLLFYGEMGVGKTSLITEICKQLKVVDRISSPTYALVNEYQTSEEEPVFHFDFYRIKYEEEALDMGIEEYLHNNNWCLIEWPQNIENLLPFGVLRIYLSLLPSGQRNIQLK
jgi:tRNA threonylcarbamoyladenosine biosynthesis protein TsaE